MPSSSIQNAKDPRLARCGLDPNVPSYVSNFRPLMLLTQVKAGDLAVPYRISELDILFGSVCRALPAL